MLLLKSDIEVNKNTIIVKMRIKGADFLRAKKTDKRLEKMIKNIYGKDYQIILEENIDINEIKKYEASIKKLEEQEIEKMLKEKEEKAKEKEQKDEDQIEENPVPEFIDPDYKMPDDMEISLPEDRNRK